MKTVAKAAMSSDLVTTHPMEPLSVAYGRLIENNIRHLPVIDDAGEVVGIISDRDFKKAMRKFASPGETASFDEEDTVELFMSWPVSTITSDMGLVAVARKMIDEKVSAFLVVDDGELKGILTNEDLLFAFISSAEGSEHREGEPLFNWLKENEYSFKWRYEPQLGRFVSQGGGSARRSRLTT